MKTTNAAKQGSTQSLDAVVAEILAALRTHVRPSRQYRRLGQLNKRMHLMRRFYTELPEQVGAV